MCVFNLINILLFFFLKMSNTIFKLIYDLFKPINNKEFCTIT